MRLVLARDLRGWRISVNAVAPGPIATKLFLDGKPKEVIDRLKNLAPLERLGEPSDVAAVVSFLAGPDGGWINGQVLRPHGGVILAALGNSHTPFNPSIKDNVRDIPTGKKVLSPARPAGFAASTPPPMPKD